MAQSSKKTGKKESGHIVERVLVLVQNAVDRGMHATNELRGDNVRLFLNAGARRQRDEGNELFRSTEGNSWNGGGQ